MKRTVLYLAGLLCMLLLQVSCKENAPAYPPVQLEFISAHANESGTFNYFLTDGKKAYCIENASRFANMHADTVYRMVCNYEVITAPSSAGKGKAWVYALLQAVSVNPVTEEQIGGKIKTDPLKVQSIWKNSSDYINMVLLIKNQGGKHTFHFIDQGITEQGGRKKLSLLLYHDKGNDAEAYTERAYLSVPLLKYKDVSLSAGDMIDFRINTYSGMKTYSFTY